MNLDQFTANEGSVKVAEAEGSEGLRGKGVLRKFKQIICAEIMRKTD